MVKKLESGQLFEGRYRVERLLGEGAMGIVFQAADVETGRGVAVKLLREDADADALQRFCREAEAATAIGSEHIVDVYASGMVGERPYMVMQLLEGETLDRRLAREGALAPYVAVALTTQLLMGIAAAHRSGIVHRDLKPENVFLSSAAEWAPGIPLVKVFDFGISKFNEHLSETAQETQTGAMLGTPFYMSPEQMRSAKAVDRRSDVYSTGVILYEMLAGQNPFAGATLLNLLERVFTGNFPPLESLRSELPAPLCAVVARALRFEADERFASAEAMNEALEPFCRESLRARAMSSQAASMPAASIQATSNTPRTQVSRGPVATVASMDTEKRGAWVLVLPVVALMMLLIGLVLWSL
jgi:serine/threonine protein kinase